jgi:hypothetical protein
MYTSTTVLVGSRNAGCRTFIQLLVCTLYIERLVDYGFADELQLV